MEDFIALIADACRKDALKKLVLSRPVGDGAKKVSARLCLHRGRRLLAMEYTLDGDTVSQKNTELDGIEAELKELLPKYRQANLITALGDAEYKLARSGKAVTLGADKLKRKLSGGGDFAIAIEGLDRKKTYILDGTEDFLIKLGISDGSGRVHDKKQGKFRQINKFLEYIEEIYSRLPAEGELCIYDLCCGKSYLSFAVYYYLTVKRGRSVYMLGIDLKRDVISFCADMAEKMGFSGMHFRADDINNTPEGVSPHMVISLHACDTATDAVLDTAARLGAKVILSTPCCHRNLASKINCRELDFVTGYAKLKGKLCEALTDALRLARLRAFGYEVSATELVDPEDTPKNTLLRAIRTGEYSRELYGEYVSMLKLLLGDKYTEYLNNL